MQNRSRSRWTLCLRQWCSLLKNIEDDWQSLPDVQLLLWRCRPHYHHHNQGKPSENTAELLIGGNNHVTTSLCNPVIQNDKVGSIWADFLIRKGRWRWYSWARWLPSESPLFKNTILPFPLDKKRVILVTMGTFLGCDSGFKLKYFNPKHDRFTTLKSVFFFFFFYAWIQPDCTNSAVAI